VEFNASDVRNKKLIDEVMKTIAGTHGLGEYFGSKSKVSEPLHHLLLTVLMIN
jgi:hypothetical protein